MEAKPHIMNVAVQLYVGLYAYMVQPVNPAHRKTVLPGFLEVGWRPVTRAGHYLMWADSELSVSLPRQDLPKSSFHPACLSAPECP